MVFKLCSRPTLSHFPFQFSSADSASRFVLFFSVFAPVVDQRVLNSTLISWNQTFVTQEPYVRSSPNGYAITQTGADRFEKSAHFRRGSSPHKPTRVCVCGLHKCVSGCPLTELGTICQGTKQVRPPPILSIKSISFALRAERRIATIVSFLVCPL